VSWSSINGAHPSPHDHTYHLGCTVLDTVSPRGFNILELKPHPHSVMYYSPREQYFIILLLMPMVHDRGDLGP
jgi:hypothetical protein